MEGIEGLEGPATGRDTVLEICCTRKGRTGCKVTLVASLGGESFTDEVQISSHAKRCDYVERLLQRFAGLEMDRDAVESQLEFIAAEHAARGFEADPDDMSPRSGASGIIESLREAGVEWFHDQAGGDEPAAFVSVVHRGRRQTFAVRSGVFRQWLTSLLYARGGEVPGAQQMADAINLVEGAAIHEGLGLPVGLRLAGHDGAIWVDLGDRTWRVVKITSGGWEVTDAENCPVRFFRRRGMLALPEPRHGGSIDLLWNSVNVSDDHRRALIVGFLIGAYAACGPFPILELSGEPGSAKSTAARFLRALIDPNRAPIRAEPRCERDLVISAGACRVIAIDNVSRVPPWLSDALCRVSTGGGFATRALYTNDDEFIFDGTRPIILTGVAEVSARSDLIDRAIQISLDPIPESKRRTERALLAEFERDRPLILGAIMDAVGCALRRRDSIKFARPPRMADWAEWVTAAEPALGMEDGAMMRAFELDRSSAHHSAVEASPIGPAIVAFMAQHCGAWEGTATELLEALKPTGQPNPKDWPQNAQRLGGELRMIARDLRAIGIEIEFAKTGRSRTRIIRMCSVATPGAGDILDAGEPSAAAPSAGESGSGAAGTATGGADGADDGCANSRPASNSNYWQLGG